jgi:hypothetical protein
MSRNDSVYENRPSLYEIRCENGEIDEDAWRYEPVDFDGGYMIEQYKYAISFPKEWAMSHLPGTGPEQCGNCYDYGSVEGLFVGYCLNCARYDYNGERGPGMDTGAVTEDAEQDVEQPQKNDRMAKLRELADELDYVFRIAEGTVPPDDQCALDYFGIEK